MDKFVNLVKKKTRNVVGILSGTSVDAVDIVLIKIKGKGTSSRIKVIDFKSYPINLTLKTHILSFSYKNKNNVEDLCRLNFIIGNLFAEVVNKFKLRGKVSNVKIDLIGSHGQTIFHAPENIKKFGFDSKSTLQTGDPSVIANRTGITTIGDFRTADIAVGGDGAPLVPYLDYVLFNDNKISRAFLNIGGISNVTFLKKKSKQNDVIAFDTGPGNMILDAVMLKLFNRKFDKDGSVSDKGTVNIELFKFLTENDKFYKKKFPKSTGREYYNEGFVEAVLKFNKKIDNKDIIATVTKYTAYTIYYNLKRFKIDELVVSGGGSKNIALMHFMEEYFGEVKIKTINQSGITAENKEAVLFAVLANEILNGNKTNMPSVTGSKKNVYLGKICIA